MPDEKTPSNLDLGLYPGDPPPRRITGVEIVAIALSLGWLGVVALYGLEGGSLAPSSTLNTVLTALAVLMPVALIWVAASAARTARALREEAARLQASIDAMRATYVQHQQRAALDLNPSVVEKLDALMEAQKKASASPTFTSLRTQAPADSRAAVTVETTPAPDQPQPSLALSAPAPKVPISVADFIKAMNFPENEHDKEGFRTLRRALEDPATERLIRASQDALTLLSQDGVYMDDLRPDHARPEVWRKFAQGERGRAVADLGGIHDRSSLVLAAGRMRKDPVFRDVVHHFLRHFDRTFTEFEKNASDADIAAMANTRTSRAFMLLGRVTGTFD